ncbi:hypothetical protein [Leisingera sp.]|uniref:hypothetical protein n=1 Tax=Leisingera sp. TaxID=1879318 RepID=UPI002B27AE1F|nr:hypothetical protein [Leisingera sp.]
MTAISELEQRSTLPPPALKTLGRRWGGKARQNFLRRRGLADTVLQNGGFCTFGVSKGKKFDGDPQYAEIVEGRLYVFLNEEVLRAYQEDRAGTIARAAENWPRIQHAAAAEL